MLLLNLIQVAESISGSVVPLAMFCTKLHIIHSFTKGLRCRGMMRWNLLESPSTHQSQLSPSPPPKDPTFFVKSYLDMTFNIFCFHHILSIWTETSFSYVKCSQIVLNAQSADTECPSNCKIIRTISAGFLGVEWRPLKGKTHSVLCCISCFIQTMTLNKTVTECQKQMFSLQKF